MVGNRILRTGIALGLVGAIALSCVRGDAEQPITDSVVPTEVSAPCEDTGYVNFFLDGELIEDPEEYFADSEPRTYGSAKKSFKAAKKKYEDYPELSERGMRVNCETGEETTSWGTSWGSYDYNEGDKNQQIPFRDRYQFGECYIVIDGNNDEYGIMEGRRLHVFGSKKDAEKYMNRAMQSMSDPGIDDSLSAYQRNQMQLRVTTVDEYNQLRDSKE